MSAAPAPVDSAPAVDVAPDSGPTTDTAAATHPDSQDSDAPTADVSTDTDETDSDEDDTPEGQDDGQTDEQRKLSRSERRRIAEEKRIEAAVEARLAAREQEQQTKAQQAEAEAKAKQADTEWQQRFADLVGTPEVHTSLNQEIAALTREIVSLKPYGDNTSLDVLEEKQTLLDQKLAQREQLAANQKLYDEIDRFQFARMSNDFLALADSLPPEHAALYRQAQTPAAALVRLEAGIVAREAAKAEARVKSVEAEWSGKLAKEQAAHAATRTGAPASGPSPNGANGNGTAGVLTLAQYRSLPADQQGKFSSKQIDEMVQRELAARR